MGTSGGSSGSTYTMLVSCAHRQHRQLLSLRTLRLGHNGLTRLRLTSEGEDGDDSSLETSGKQTSSFDTDVSDDAVQLSEILPILYSAYFYIVCIRKYLLGRLVKSRMKWNEHVERNRLRPPTNGDMCTRRREEGEKEEKEERKIDIEVASLYRETPRQ